MKKLLTLSSLFLLLVSCENKGGLSQDDKVWIEKRMIAISDSVFNNKFSAGNGADMNSELKEDETNKTLPKNLSPKEVYNQFSNALAKNDLSLAQKYIHSEGIYFFGDRRIGKSDFTKSIGNKASSILMDGKISVENNYSNAAGWDGNFYSPHLDFDDWIERDGFFLEGSKIIIIDPNPEINDECLLLELYPDNNEWRIYAVGMWYWSP